MSEAGDWRLLNLRRLQGQSFTKERFEPQENWDHEHCVGCYDKFADAGLEPDVIQDGFVSIEGKDWICPECFGTFGPILDWTLRTDADELETLPRTEN